METGKCCQQSFSFPRKRLPEQSTGPPLHTVVLAPDTGHQADTGRGESPGRSEVGCLALSSFTKSSWSLTPGAGGRPGRRMTAQSCRAYRVKLCPVPGPGMTPTQTSPSARGLASLGHLPADR